MSIPPGFLYRLIVDVATSDDHKVLEHSAEGAQPTTIYIFTHPGSQEAGMEWTSTIHQQYTDLIYDTIDKDGQVNILLLFGASCLNAQVCCVCSLPNWHLRPFKAKRDPARMTAHKVRASYR